MSKPNDKLTQQAVRQQDNVHPTFKATPFLPNINKPKEQINGRPDDLSRRRSRVPSTSESVASRSPINSKPTGMTIFRVVAATRTWQRLAKINSAKKHKAIKLENTYKLEPEDDNKFKTEKVEGLLKDILNSRCEHMEYDATKCAALSKDLSKFIHSRVRCLGFPRYKYIVHVTIIQNNGQGMQISSRYVWNADHDRCATYTFNNANLIVTAQVYAVYFE